MFRIGGSANEEGIMNMAVPKRAGYQEPTGAATTLDNYKLDPNDPLYKEAMRNAAIMNQFAGSGRSERDRVLDLLLRGSIKLASERPAGNIFSTAAKAFQEPVDQYLKSGETEDTFQRQLRLAGLTSAMTSQENREKYKKELEIANQKLEQGEKELFLKTSGLGTNAGSIYETKRALEKKGEVVVGAISTVGTDKTKKPVPSAVLSIPEGRIFYDTDGNFYRRVSKDQSKEGWKRVQLSGEDIKAEAIAKPTGFFEQVKEKGAAYDPRSWNKQKFYEQLTKKNPPSTME
jgi:Tat protein secretion system quality control protein TatD with DNase activity